MARPTLFALIFFHLSLTNINAQKNIDSQKLLWIRYFLKLKLTETYQIKHEFEERTYCFPWRQHQFVSRTHLARKMNYGWNTAIGFTYFVQSLPHDPEISNFENNIELRPQLEVANKQPISSKFSIHHRYWSEFRFFEQPDHSFDFENIRIRYKLELRYALSKQLTVKAFDEIHLNIGKKITQNVFDQNRYGTSIHYMPVENFGFEIGYFNWYQQRASGIDFFNRHIIRFTIHHEIKFNNYVRTF
ncbi:DUF2490 domain-containing protein [Aureibacter tunicatorum]|uniref:DUF2490 domain-containing protein n=1 Tax=Aureibacter tunicatorum TaxID=866807 RepID=A0AAE3XRS8_9BACT|nr:DUF2490 domain-containing protein [Aureibacter tunicatorum]MDR6241432.1 hypothetical protein [Aureibacter tunicatorum]BDD06723.1 hypothetical protein AUTU_42060 [Aureibacter tunicatorum]